MSTFVCTTCGQEHGPLPSALGAQAPDYWLDLPPDQRAYGKLDEETCVVNNEYFFLKGTIDVPIRGEDGFFTFMVWVALAQADFERVLAQWNNPLRANQPALPAWLATQVPGYPASINLKTNLHLNELGVRPSVILAPSNHPLSIEQRAGITRANIQAIVELLIHAEGP